MIIESTGTPALYLGFTLLVVILLAVDFLGYLGSVIFGVFGDIWGQSKNSLESTRILGVSSIFYSDPKYLKTHWKAQEFWG